MLLENSDLFNVFKYILWQTSQASLMTKIVNMNLNKCNECDKESLQKYLCY